MDYEFKGTEVPTKLNSQQLVREIAEALHVDASQIAMTHSGAATVLVSRGDKIDEVKTEALLVISAPDNRRGDVAKAVAAHKPNQTDAEELEEKRGKDLEYGLERNPAFARLAARVTALEERKG